MDGHFNQSFSVSNRLIIDKRLYPLLDIVKMTVFNTVIKSKTLQLSAKVYLVYFKLWLSATPRSCPYLYHQTKLFPSVVALNSKANKLQIFLTIFNFPKNQE